MEWIKFDYRYIPETPFLCIDQDGIYSVAYWSGGCLIKGEWYGTCEYGCGGDIYITNIKYWSELPKPPESE